MLILFLALLFGIIVMALLVKSFAKNKDVPSSKVYRILKLILFAETVAFIVLFGIVIIKTMFM